MYPHGISHTPVSAIANENNISIFLSIVFFFFWKNAIYTQATNQERYIIDHIEKVTPAGVMADGNIFEISAWVIPPIRYGDHGMLTRVVNPMVRKEAIRRR